jgi:D-arabinose 1-dehydrogenase-like Zn-dependent alcohol dehydrogenase
MALMRRQSLVKFDAPFCETELMTLARAGKVKPVPMQEKPMGETQKWIDERRAGEVVGRIMLAN